MVVKHAALARRAKSRTSTSLVASAVTEPANQVVRPDFFRLPKQKSGGDPYFHLSRATYYQGEALGWWKFIKICKPGKSRGIVLIKYSDVAEFVRRQEKNGGA
jgi:hypothetical protein